MDTYTAMYDKKERFQTGRVKRAALYARVSHEEQAKEGISLDAQMDALERYATDHEYKIVGQFKDEGVSATKHWTTRKDGLMKLLDEVEEDKIDVILFTKLDRWTRNPSHYYALQEILDAHKTVWECVEEDYETSTTYGEFKVNLMLAIGRQEARRTGDRIKATNKYMISQGYIVTGAIPYGYIKEDKEHRKRLLKNPELEDIIPEMFKTFLETKSIVAVRRRMEELGHDWSTETWRARLVHPIYTGCYRGNKNYCEPYITPETHEKVMEILSGNVVRMTSSGRVYLFSTLLKCPYCGHNLVAAGTAHKGTEYLYYRCHHHYKTGCPMHKRVREDRIEKWLLEHIENEFKVDRKMRMKKAKAKPKPKGSKKIDYQGRLNRLNKLYIRGAISDEEYDEQAKEIQEKIKEQEKKEEKVVTEAQVKHVEKLLSGFRDAYDNLDQESKRLFWHALIKAIYVTPEGEVDHVEFVY